MSRSRDEQKQSDVLAYAAAPGEAWWAQVRRGGEKVEYSGPGVFDELVVDHWLHLEQLDERAWWMRVGDAAIDVFVESDGTVVVNIRRGAHGGVCGTTASEATE